MSDETVRVGGRCRRYASLFALALLTCGFFAGVAQAETRVLKFYNLHTKEKASFAYKRNGSYDQSELKRLNWFMRDWRKKKARKMDPRLWDVIWNAYQQSGSDAYISVICGYRTSKTNAMLRSGSSGVAKTSQHTLGRALDFFIPDVPLKKLRDIGLKMQAGGVGYYPKSGSPFVHFDVGNARHWPRMSRRQLAQVFPNGHTVHVPADGKPLPGYKQAMANYKQRRRGSTIQVANAEDTGGGKSFLAMLFGGDNEAGSSARRPASEGRRVAQSSSRSQPARREVTIPSGANAVLPSSRPTGLGGDAGTAVAALAAASVPMPSRAPTRVDDATATMVADLEAQADAARDGNLADPSETGTELAYAVPKPNERPMFDTVLDGDRTARGEAASRSAAGDEPRPETVKAVKVAARNSADSDPAADELLVEAAAKPAERPSSPETAFAVKGGRIGALEAATHAPRARRLDPQEAIASRIEMATLVTDPDARAETISTAEPNTRRLVGDRSEDLYARHFRKGTNEAGSDRFAGSAVTFSRRATPER